MRRLLATFVYFLTISSFTFTGTACAEHDDTVSRAEKSYKKLCKIYRDEINNQKPMTMERIHDLVVRISQEVPELRVENYYISRADRKDVYDLYKQSAEYAIGKPWDCPAIKDYYQIKWKE